ncbi:pep-cterm sorting domain-containing protein [Anaeramoeba flamelloides]|uniref:Pep-cterm sorting domain-containing protein n=1 Tax=Anaeramoeba flamelloides TaxID=1746091 RepID=A0AAV8A5T2_9EUKA|nr:pep-cterm sorting domain-containing protein [Anaeramoeba flamelloides]
MDLDELKLKFQPYYQQCPGCKELNIVIDEGIGFQKCTKCQKIYCTYCGLEHHDELHGLSHFLSCHNIENEREVKIANLEEIAQNLELVDLAITYGNKALDIMAKKDEDFKNIFAIFATKRNESFLTKRQLSFQCGNNQSTNWNSIQENKISELFQTNKGEIKIIRRRIKMKSKRVLPLLSFQRLDVKRVFEPFHLRYNNSTETEVRKKLAVDLSLESEKIILFMKGEKLDPKQNISFREITGVEYYTLWVVTSDEYERANKLMQSYLPYQKLLEAKEHTDMEISGIKVHSSMLRLRTDLEPQYIKNHLEKALLNEDYYQEFVDFIYGKDFKIQNESVKDCFRVLGLDFENFPSFGEQLTKKFNKDNDEKDFTILVPDPEEPEEVDEIDVHKIILQARSGLYRNMFNNVQDNTSQVKDFSGKSIDTLELIIKYFYTGNLDITADMDIDIILEELQDAQEYFQIDPKLNFVNDLHQLTRKYQKN